MREGQIIASTDAPRTRASLAADLLSLGLAPGDIVIAHTALSALGWVNGGAQTAIDAMLDVIGPDGTLVMPAQSGQLTDPAQWQAPPVPAGWIEAIRNTMPVYDPRRTPTRGLGQVAELFRTWPGTVRSAHPHTSFAALGRAAASICAVHRLESPFGEDSPLARLYELDARVLLVGVSFDACTALHLAETRAPPEMPAQRQGARLLLDGTPRWVTYDEPPMYDEFPDFGFDRLVESGVVRSGKVGSASTFLAPMRILVDTALAAWRDARPPIG